ncbi:type IV leader peptidase family protein [Stackebrandtia endophytica]|uniref:Type IV leader peptidase family protein n=1 Tax=Stackebrandtia endophytica TaxID=1496996 RepID=A0A543ASA4_9ACTN|nr:prepilin peptidase [Stackebrandtia endophytica]TQL75385.1 type IV leader peptidase family protein [Stackebrandtia endophytica]
MLVGVLVGAISGVSGVAGCRPVLVDRAWWWLAPAGAVLGGLTALVVDGGWWVAAAFAVVAGTAPALAVVDVLVHRLPFPVTIPVGLVSLGCFSAAAVTEGGGGRLVRAVVAAVVVGAVFLVISLASRGGLGLGDVVLAAVLALSLGWVSWRAVWGGMLAGLVAAAIVTAIAGYQRYERFPLGPFLIFGWLTIVYFG